MTKDIIDVLETAVLRLRKGWVQKALCVTKVGNVCNPNSPDADAWCLIGALSQRENECGLGTNDVSYQAILYVRDALRSIELACWNDAPSRSQAEVIALVEQTIKLVRSKENHERNTESLDKDSV